MRKVQRNESDKHNNIEIVQKYESADFRMT